jgi:hypothetical protein
MTVKKLMLVSAMLVTPFTHGENAPLFSLSSATWDAGQYQWQPNLPEQIEEGFRFNGKIQRIELPASPLPERFTFLTWCAPERQHKLGNLICKVGWHTRLGIDGRGRPFFDTFTEDKKYLRVNAKTVPSGQWTLLAGVCYGDNLVLYVDGKMAAFVEIPGKLLTNKGKFYIGCANPASKSHPGYYTGRLDRARVWYRALSAEEIATIYQNENK